MFVTRLGIELGEIRVNKDIESVIANIMNYRGMRGNPILTIIFNAKFSKLL